MADPNLTPKTCRALGHDFRLMTKAYYEPFAGAEPGSWICYLGDVTLILTPNETEVAVIDNETGNETYWEVVR